MRDAAEIAGELVASGLTPVQMALVMELVLSMSTGLSAGQGGENRAILNRRAWDRDRKARQREADREARKLSAMSTGLPPVSTGLPPDKAETCLSVEEKEEGLSVRKESKKGSRLLSDMRVSDELRAIAIENGCPPDRVDAVWSEFVDYWADIPGRYGCKLSWKGTWRNRIKSIFGGRNGRGTDSVRTDPTAGRATAREAHQVAAMGGAALRYLKESHAAGQNGDSPRGDGTAEGFDFGQRAKIAG